MAITILEQCHVAPTPLVPSASLPLTFYDVSWLFVSPTEWLFFFPCLDASDAIPNLKSSLSCTLHHFFPLAGRVRLVPGSTNRHEIHYADGDSVSFIVAQTDMDFNDLIGNQPRKYCEIRSLISPLPEGALLGIQVTLFPGHGLSICFTVHHVACDGLSMVHFFKSWASSCKSNREIIINSSPLFDRSLILDPFDLYSERNKQMATMIADGSAMTARTDLVCATFILGGDMVTKLKDLVGGRASTFVVSCAYLWVCIMKSREHKEHDKMVYFVFTADWRKRLLPQLPEAYFGNCITPCIAEAKASSLVGKDGFIAASEAIGRAIGELEEGVFIQMRRSSGRLKSVAAADGIVISVASSPKFGVYEVDFGWGRPAKVEMPAIEMKGGISLTESRMGDIGVEIGIVLPEQQMHLLATNFEIGLKCV